jgi:hypothetical protein
MRCAGRGRAWRKQEDVFDVGVAVPLSEKLTLGPYHFQDSRWPCGCCDGYSYSHCLVQYDGKDTWLAKDMDAFDARMMIRMEANLDTFKFRCGPSYAGDPNRYMVMYDNQDFIHIARVIGSRDPAPGWAIKDAGECKKDI